MCASSGLGRSFDRSISPRRSIPESAKAELKNGMLHVTAAIAMAAEAKKVDIKAA